MMVGMTAPQTPNPAPSADAPAAVPRAATRVRASEPVSYTHLTLPTICSV